MSAFIAVRFATVSSSVSPLVCEDVAILRFTTSADKRFAAISKVVRVRVLGSKNRLKIALPRKSGTFFTSCSVTETKERAVSRICSRTSGGRPSIVSRCLSLPSGVNWRFAPCASTIRALQRQAHHTASITVQDDRLLWRHLELRSHVLRANRQLPTAAVDQCGKANGARPAVIENLVHRRTNGTPGIQHIVHQDDVSAL